MSCNYCQNCDLIRTTAIEYEKDVLILTIPAMKIRNHQKFYLSIDQELPEEDITSDTTVIVYVGNSSVKYTPVTRLGNLMYADAIKSKRIYPLFAATDTKAFVLSDICRLKRTDHDFPIDLPAKEIP